MLKDTITGIQGNDTFEKQVNIGLFNDVAAFVMATTAKETAGVRGKLNAKHLWYFQSDNRDIQENYGFRYLGELLERYEDKFGSDIRDIRAIALAIAYTNELLSDDMFVGSQRATFIKKITCLSDGDIYLMGALYLLDSDEISANARLEEMAQATYTRTEEILFIASLYDGFEASLRALRTQLFNLLGTGRTMPVFGNMDTYAWLIKRLCHTDLKSMRTKDKTLFRALAELPFSFVKAESRHHGVLLENGYTVEEIAYLNSAVLRYSTVYGAVRLESIVAEKIAVEACKLLINGEKAYPADVYEHLKWLLTRYSSFEIKIGGNHGIYQAVADDIKLVNPKTFIWLYEQFEVKDVFRFDILDDKWDVLSLEIEAGSYLRLFDKQLLYNADETGAKIKERIQKYEALTGVSFLSRFNRKHDYNGDSIFALLVNKGVIDLAALFSSCSGLGSIKDKTSEEEKPPMLKYIGHYIRGIHSREAFEFFRYFLREHDFADMNRLFTDGNSGWGYRNGAYFFVDELYKGPRRNYGDKEQRFEVKRSFLSQEENRELLGWLDDYMIQFKAGEYAEYAALMLLDPFITTLFPQTELRDIYDMVKDLDVGAVKGNTRELKQKYLTESELMAEREASELQEQERKRLAHEQEIQGLRNELSKLYDGSFKSLLKYLDNHNYRFRDRSDAYRLAAEHLNTALTQCGYTLGTEEAGHFLIFGGKLLKEGAVTFETLTKHISMIKEDASNAENNGTTEAGSDID